MGFSLPVLEFPFSIEIASIGEVSCDRKSSDTKKIVTAKFGHS